ncbi:MAG TPA: DUF3365 domain-containing protein [Chromobacteriaceae bacterium]|nr:DUF3365 domain-containing protein [Chromobacteriaceae bacterium]
MLRPALALVLASFSVSALAADPAPEIAPLQDAANRLLQRLGSALKQEMSTHGPVTAIGVCKDLAPQLAGELSRENGWKVTRVSLKVRNPMLGLPDAWEQQQLLNFDAQAKNGAAPASLQHAEIITAPAGRYQRYVKAIPMQPMCLTCHGPAEQIPAEVRQALQRSYPHDKATGYQPGMIRGAVSITRPLP